MFDWILLSGLLVSLVFWIPSRIDGGELFSFHFLMFAAILAFFVRPKRELKLGLLGLLAALALFSTLFHFRIPVRQELMNVFVGVLAIKTIAERTQLTYKKIGWPLIGWAIVNIFFLVLQIFRHDPIFQRVYEAPAGTMLIPWALGCAAIMALPFIFAVHPAACLLLAPLVLYSHSTACCAIAAISFSALFFNDAELKKMAWTILELGLFSLIFLLFFSHVPNWDRITVLKNSFKYAEPWFGQGIGSWPHEGFTMRNGKDTYWWQWAHNEFYQQYFEQGRTGLALLMAWVISLVAGASRIQRVSVLSLCVLCLVHPVMHWQNLPVLGIFIIVMAQIKPEVST